jgi:hypothetical protein
MPSVAQRAFILRRWLMVLIFSVPSFAQTQSSTGIVTGTVTDVNTGAAIPKVEIILQQINGLARQTVTDTTGHFRIEAMLGGEYILKASSFTSVAYQRPIRVTIPTTNENIKLRLADCLLPVTPTPPPPEFIPTSLTATLPLTPLPPIELHARKLPKRQ